MRTSTMVGLGVLWCIVVFAGTLYATFPSDELIQRAKIEVPDALGPEYSIDIASVSPWWVGVSASDVHLYKTQRSGDAAGGRNLLECPFDHILNFGTPHLTDHAHRLGQIAGRDEEDIDVVNG